MARASVCLEGQADDQLQVVLLRNYAVGILRWIAAVDGSRRAPCLADLVHTASVEGLADQLSALDDAALTGSSYDGARLRPMLARVRADRLRPATSDLLLQPLNPGSPVATPVPRNTR